MSVEYAIEGRGVVWDRGRFRLGPVDILLPRGQVMGLVGPNGSGKTTHQGNSWHDEHRRRNPFRVWLQSRACESQRVGAVLDADYLVPGWSIEQAIRAVRPFYPNWDQDYAEHLLHQFRLDLSARVKELSSGEGNKLALLRWRSRRDPSLRC